MVAIPTNTPLVLFENQTTDGLSPSFTAGNNPDKSRKFVIEILDGSTLGTATLWMEQQDLEDGTKWHKTGDTISSSDTLPLTATFSVMTGNFRFSLEGATAGTNINMKVRFNDTTQYF
jgi:hypothetical protein